MLMMKWVTTYGGNPILAGKACKTVFKFRRNGQCLVMLKMSVNIWIT
ncbi:MAG: hypothetical protein V8R63_11775 [Thomasclavelia ramosa]